MQALKGGYMIDSPEFRKLVTDVRSSSLAWEPLIEHIEFYVSAMLEHDYHVGVSVEPNGTYVQVWDGETRLHHDWYEMPGCEAESHAIRARLMAGDMPVAVNPILELTRKVFAQQAKIDALMFEFCPDEMSAEQITEWAKHQRRAPDDIVPPDMRNGDVTVKAPLSNGVDSPELIALLDAYCADGTNGYQHWYERIVAHLAAKLEVVRQDGIAYGAGYQARVFDKVRTRLHARITELEKKNASIGGEVLDLATLVRRLASALLRADLTNALAAQAYDYLEHKGLTGSPLRQTCEPSPYQSRVCELGTRGCMLNHGGA